MISESERTLCLGHALSVLLPLYRANFSLISYTSRERCEMSYRLLTKIKKGKKDPGI
jgi:hypothetical protein